MTKKGGPRCPRATAVAEMVRGFPKSSHYALARKLYSDHPELFTTFDSARSAVRYVRGKRGNANRKKIDKHYDTIETHVRHSGDWAGLPDGKRQLPNWKVIKHNRPGWWLVMGDIHIPWHDRKSVSALIREAKKRKVVGILLNGDIVDCYDCSDHERDPCVREFKNEIETVRKFLESLRKEFPKSEICWKEGNHEARYARFMRRKAPELLDLDDFQWESICRTKQYGIEYVGDCQPVMLGKLATIHGHEYKFAISNPVSASRGLFLRAGVTSICNHFHRTSQFSKANLFGDIISTWSIGCLCDIRPYWLPINDWNLGGMFVHISPDGSFDIDNRRCIDGKLRQ